MEYKEYKLSELSKDNKGTYGIGASAVEYSKDLYTYLRITDIKEDGSLDYKNLKSVDDKNAEKYLLKKGDIVFARTGNSTGKAYYYDGEIQNLVYAGFLIKFSLDENKVNPKFMKYYTMTKEYKNWVKEIQTGSTRGNINEKMYRFFYLKGETPYLLKINPISSDMSWVPFPFLELMSEAGHLFDKNEICSFNETRTSSYIQKVYNIKLTDGVKFCLSDDAFDKFINSGGVISRQELYELKFSNLKNPVFVLNNNFSQDEKVKKEEIIDIFMYFRR